MGLFDFLKRKPAAAAATATSGILSGSRASSGKSTVEHPLTRSRYIWTPDDIDHALRRADSGDMSRLADLVEWTLGDDRVSSVYETRAADVLGAEVSFEASGDGRRKNRPVADLEADEDYWRLFPEPEVIEWLKWGWVAGIGFAQFVDTKRVPGGRLVPRLQPWHLRWTRFDWERRQWFALTGESGDVEVPINPGDGQWLAFCPWGTQRPWARGQWRGVSRLALLKHYATIDLARTSEAHGKPAWFASGAKTIQEREQIAADLSNLGSDPVLAAMGDIDVKLIAAEANTGDIFFRQFEYANRAIAIVATGGNLATESEANVATGATAQEKIQQKRKEADAERISTTKREQGLKPWAFWNFGDERLAPWPVFKVEEDEDLTEVATLWKTVGEALQNFDDVGFEVDPNDIKERFGIELRAKPKPEPVPPPNDLPQVDEDDDGREGDLPDASRDGNGPEGNSGGDPG